MPVGNIPLRVSLLFAATAQTFACAQAPRAGQGRDVLDARAAEIKRLSPNDRDLGVAVDALTRSLRRMPQIEENVGPACPPRPAPAPAGSVRRPGAMNERKWAAVVPGLLPKAEAEAAAGLSAGQRHALTTIAVPEFRRPGSPEKFEVVIQPNCPSPGPAPAGQVRDPKL